MSKYNRADATFGAYATALGIIVLVLVVMALVAAGRRQEHIPSVDYRADVTAVRADAAFPVPVPEGLPEGWVPTSSDVESPGDGAPVTWTLGFATPKDRHAELSVSDAEPAEFIAERTRKGTPDGESRVRGAAWKRYDVGKGRHALVRRGDEATTVVSGSTDYAELAVLAKSLKTGE